MEFEVDGISYSSEATTNTLHQVGQRIFSLKDDAPCAHKEKHAVCLTGGDIFRWNGRDVPKNLPYAELAAGLY
jgi:hypothetical protein